jgi:cyanophycinase
MLTTHEASQGAKPFMHRNMIHFAPGLGLINQIVLDGDDDPEPKKPRRLARLLTAISYNPFLIGVDLDTDTGAIVYPDSTMEVFGAGTALVADGENVSYANTHERDRTREGEAQPIGMLDVKLHILASEHTYNLRHRTSRPPDTSDIPRVTDAVKSAY